MATAGIANIPANETASPASFGTGFEPVHANFFLILTNSTEKKIRNFALYVGVF